MADEEKSGGEESQDPNNLKAEFSRKVQNLQEANQKLSDEFGTVSTKLDQLVNQVAIQQTQAEPQTQAQVQGESMEDLWLTDPQKAHLLQRKMDREEDRKENRADALAQQQKTAVLGQLVADYPELSDQQSPMYKQAMQMANELPAHLRDSAEGYKLAASSAAQQLGVLPMTHRKKADSAVEFMSGAGNPGLSEGADSRGAGVKLPDEMLRFAQAMGKNVSDKKYLEKLKNFQRKRWTRYQGRKEGA